MSERKPSPGRLISLEGSYSANLRAGASDLLRQVRASRARRGCSFWDASSIFLELSMNAKAEDPPSAKTLLILYAADLAFRLRWEIEPAIAEGYTVVAAPYTKTAINAGKAAGLSSKWLAALFEFAPKPYDSFWLETRWSPDAPKPRALSGFPEFCFATLERVSPQFDRNELLEKHIAILERDADAGRLKRLRMPAD